MREAVNQSNRRERIIARNKARRRRQLQNHIVIVSVTVCLILLFSLFLGSFLSEAKEKSSAPNEAKCFKSVMLMYGETLEDVAEKNFNENAYACVADYMTEIMDINSLDHAACVTPGQYVVIPYFTAKN